MYLIGHATREEADAAARALHAMGAAARRLLAECVEHQGVSRAKASPTAERLYDYGFISIRDIGCVVYPMGVALLPTLTGEEALEALELLEEAGALESPVPHDSRAPGPTVNRHSHRIHPHSPPTRAPEDHRK